MQSIIQFVRNHPLFGYVLIVLAVAAAVYGIQQRSITTQRDSELFTCYRVQLLRDQANATNFLIYDTFHDLVVMSEKRLKAPNLKPAERRTIKQSLARAKHVANTTVVTGPTSCVDAVDHPNDYRAPAPSFVKSHDKQVADMRARAKAIIVRAQKGISLYGPEDFEKIKIANEPK